jgi:hypothetical protein
MRSPRLLALVLGATFLFAGAASAQTGLIDLGPRSTRVNDDPASGIESGLVSEQFDSSSATAGGSVLAGGQRAPWMAFSQLEAGDDQLFVRAFVDGRWVTQGHGTVGGTSSANPLAPSSLNFSDDSEAEQPAIDFAGPGRTVPWAVWSEQNGRSSNPAPVHAQIFASRFHPPGAAVNPDRWEFAGQNRAAAGAPPLPSLNLHVDRDARDPAVAGGPASEPAAPGPWVAWRETGAHAPGTGVDQVFVARPSSPGAGGACDPSVKLGDQTGGTPLGGTCFGQVGTERLGSDPALNVDRTRAGGDPDIAFGGPGDSVPWLVWREHGPTQTTGAGKLDDNAQIFAAKGVTPPAGSQAATDGGLTWVVVGQQTQGALDASTTGGSCGSDALNEELCSLNENLGADAGAPRVATGTMTPGAATVPWVVWAESNGGPNAIFAARLVGTGADAHFEAANQGHQLGFGTLPDITFAGNTPYVSWVAADHTTKTGHFRNPALFVADHASPSESFQRPVLTSTCTADPFSADGSACPGGALGTPFVGFDDQSDPTTVALRGASYPADAPQTGDPTAVSSSAATVAGVVTPQGARASAFFQYGPTTAYGSHSAPVGVVTDGSPILISADLTDLPAGTTIHYRLVTSNDLIHEVGNDATLVTAGAPPPSPAQDPPPVPPAPPIPPVKEPPPASPPAPATHPAPAALARLPLRVQVGNGAVRVQIAVDAAADITLHGTLTGKVKGRKLTLRLGTARAHYAHGGGKTLTLKLSARARQALRRWHAVRIALVADAASTGGTTSVRRLARLGG